MQENVSAVPLMRLFVVWMVVIAALFLLLEGGARVWAPAQPADTLQEAQAAIRAEGFPQLAEIFVPDPELFWRLRPNMRQRRFTGRIGKHPFDFECSTNALGLRHREYSPKPPSVRRILAVGDSATFGLGVEDAASWPAQLERQWNEGLPGAPLEVINAGVPGYTAYQGLRFVEREAERWQPDIVVVAFWANDHATWASRSDLQNAAMFRVRERMGILRHSRFFNVLRLLAGRFLSKEDVRPRLSPEEFRDMLTQIASRVRAMDAEPVFLVWPSRIQVEEKQEQRYGYQAILAETASACGVPLADPAPLFMQSPAWPFLDDYHGSAAGCVLAAQSVAAIITGMEHPQ